MAKFPEYITASDIVLESDDVLDQKVRALLRAMTREEKMNLCHGGANPPEQGQIANAGYLTGVPRLGVPEIRMFDGPAGVTSVYTRGNSVAMIGLGAVHLLSGAGQELKGIAAAEDPEDADVPFTFGFPATPFAVDVPGHKTKSLCTVDRQINFTCGTIDGKLNQTYKNSADGTAFPPGQVNPSGKMPTSIPAKETDTLITDTPERPGRRYLGYINAEGKKIVDFDEGIFTGYRWYDKEGVKPLYAFGHGLSYATFTYSGITARSAGDDVEVSFTVENTGRVTGTEIAQVYLTAAEVPDGIQMAAKQLCGFARIEALMPGESRAVTVTIPARSFCYWNVAQELVVRSDGTKDKWVRATGIREIMVGGSSDHLPLKTTIFI